MPGKKCGNDGGVCGKEGTEDGTGAADSVDGEFGMSNESGAETTVDGDTAANPGASTDSVEDAATVKELNRVKVKGIYVSGPMAGTAGMDNLIALVDRTELNALVIDVKNDDGYLTCELDVPLAEQIGSEKHYIKDLPALVQTCKEKNIYLIARVVAFKDPILAEKCRSGAYITATEAFSGIKAGWHGSILTAKKSGNIWHLSGKRR